MPRSPYEPPSSELLGAGRRPENPQGHAKGASERGHVQLGRVRVTPAHVEKMDGDRVIVSISRTDIVGARVAWGRLSERPVIQLVFATACVAVGMFILVGIIRWLVYGGLHHSDIIMLVLLLPLGCWLFYDALHRGCFLSIETTTGRRRLSFGQRISRAEIESFIDASNQELGCHFERDETLLRAI